MIYAVSDIHGQWARWQSVLDQIRLTDDDALYILGDVIDRGADGIRILTQIMSDPRMHMLLGNHEHMLLGALDRNEDAFWERWERNGCAPTVRAFNALPYSEKQALLAFVRNLPTENTVCANGTDFRLVHAAPAYLFDRVTHNEPDVTAFSVWYRNKFTEPFRDDEMLIYGHTPTIYFGEKEPLMPHAFRQTLDIDCGGAYPNGRLCCVRLDDMRLFYSE